MRDEFNNYRENGIILSWEEYKDLCSETENGKRAIEFVEDSVKAGKNDKTSKTLFYFVKVRNDIKGTFDCFFPPKTFGCNGDSFGYCLVVLSRKSKKYLQEAMEVLRNDLNIEKMIKSVESSSNSAKIDTLSDKIDEVFIKIRGYATKEFPWEIRIRDMDDSFALTASNKPRKALVELSRYYESPHINSANFGSGIGEFFFN